MYINFWTTPYETSLLVAQIYLIFLIRYKNTNSGTVAQSTPNFFHPFTPVVCSV